MITSINTRSEYVEALKRLAELFDAEDNTEDGLEAEELSIIVDQYEERIDPSYYLED